MQVCNRGSYALVDKAAEVLRVGGGAMILLNVATGATNQVAFFMAVPYVHLTSSQRDTVLQYVQTASPTATAAISAAQVTFGATAPQMADFSSRGPTQLAQAMIMKPDITAPGEKEASLDKPAEHACPAPVWFVY